MSSPTTSQTSPDRLDCREAADLLSAYALDALEPAERNAVSEHLAHCPGCRQQLEREEQIVALLGAAVPPQAPPISLRDRLLDEIDSAPAAPPVSLRDRLLDEIDASPPPVPLRPRRWSGPARSRTVTAGLALVASLLLIALVWAGVLLHQARQQRDTALDAQAEMAEYLQNGGDVIALAAAGSGPAASGNGSLIMEPSGKQGMLMVSDLAPSTADRQYRVWAANGNQRWTVGMLSVGANGTGWMKVKCPRPLSSYDMVGISLVGGTASPTDLLTAPVPQATQ